MCFRLCVWYCVAVILGSVSAHYTVTLTVSTTVVLTSTQTATYNAVANKTTSTATKPSPTGVKNPKRGLAFAAGDTPGDLNNANQSTSVISWQYNWGNFPPDYLVESNIKHIPMQWGGAGIDSFADQVKAQGADTILVRPLGLISLILITKGSSRRHSMSLTSSQSQIWTLCMPRSCG